MPTDPEFATPSVPESRAKCLRLRLPMASAAPELVPARMINEVLYCERLLHLEWAQGEFADNAFTVEGRAAHKRADQPGGALPEPSRQVGSAPSLDLEGPVTVPGESPVEVPSEERPYQARTLWLSSERLGITAKIDVVEGDEHGHVVPIEYKRGKVPDLPEGAYLPERAQLCAQVLLLREHGYSCDHGDIYFAGSRRRVPIAIDDALVAATLEAAARARRVAQTAEPPPPLVDSPKCNGCSLVGICLPDEINLLRGLEAERGEDALESSGANAENRQVATVEQPAVDFSDVADADPELADESTTTARRLRRLHPAADEKLPLYVQEQGARVGLDGDCLVVRARTGATVTVRLPNTSHVALFGNVQLSAQAMRALLERSVPVSFLSYGGWYYGRATGVESNNVSLRLAQHRAAADRAFCLRVARGLVASKIRNTRTLLRRNHTAPPLLVLTELERLARKAEGAEALEALLGLEGTAARSYFGAFSGMLKGEAALAGTFELDGRNRRPPRDPVNAMLSFAYALLTKDFVLALSAVGLDPLLGFYHQPRFGRPALALDLMEEFRPLVADSVVLGAINGGGFSTEDFTTHVAAVAMRPAARRRLLFAYERRMEQLITHPVFGYRISYRRVLEVQARLLARCLLGEIDEYPAFRTR
ncbi:MAG TPA: CRISPR-associated endonuclease Cas1 [Polyangiaceae bacterium]|nr:CRISPR-associated endonuclease Cas1 [Polyangiaceae bacterium]